MTEQIDFGAISKRLAESAAKIVEDVETILSSPFGSQVAVRQLEKLNIRWADWRDVYADFERISVPIAPTGCTLENRDHHQSVLHYGSQHFSYDTQFQVLAVVQLYHRSQTWIPEGFMMKGTPFITLSRLSHVNIPDLLGVYWRRLQKNRPPVRLTMT